MEKGQNMGKKGSLRDALLILLVVVIWRLNFVSL
ncbi:hypothetical protein ABB02_01887 [Clostridiaceae bacterium JG1575]|nr:hypothetical protein ABB02_01887 [Clostridiaceae bacterium JG1575]